MIRYENILLNYATFSFESFYFIADHKNFQFVYSVIIDNIGIFQFQKNLSFNNFLKKLKQNYL